MAQSRTTPLQVLLQLSAGRVSLADRAKVDRQYTTVYGVIGLARLLGGYALVVITGAEQVGVLRGYPVFTVTSTKVLAPSSKTARHSDDTRYIELLEHALDPLGAGRGLFFSYGSDITLTQQRYATLVAENAMAAKPLAARADPRFFWNKVLARPLTEAGAHKFVVPLMLGSYHQLPILQFKSAGRHVSASISLIARRSAQRPGTRHWRRGADAQGAVANFVETEQLVVLDAASGGTVSSFVQLRGSIPLLWSQIPNIKYKPPTRIAPPSTYAAVFDLHVKDLLTTYQAVTAVNLVNQHGSEGKLCMAYTQEAERFGQATSGFRLVNFDFHAECGSSRYHRLSVLWDQIRADFATFGFFMDDPQAASPEVQRGTFRINCIDCLDRTNVVQGVLGRKHLEGLLFRLGLLQKGATLQNAFPEVEQQFKYIWADHGDDISRQYAGTGALKSGFTRTGKRTKMGLVDDGVKSVVRYYLNNHQDGRKQDALDLMTGTYQVAKDKGTPFRTMPSPSLPFLVAAVSVGWAVSQLAHIAQGNVDHPTGELLNQVLLPLLLAGSLVAGVVKNGRAMVSQPQLCPGLAQPW
ncbi:hypothetical protein WJX72_002549 [[Myrmecia] bisecta]|uniref:SAC domain-containing protein n=1 Tax=[Myrmecia] bisecta TaxID=41462 RepID=A0AAW1PMA1_9CHLO